MDIIFAFVIKKQTAFANKTPKNPPVNVIINVSVIHSKEINLFFAPIALKVPISDVLSRTFTTRVLFTIIKPAIRIIVIPILKIRRIQ